MTLPFEVRPYDYAPEEFKLEKDGNPCKYCGERLEAQLKAQKDAEAKEKKRIEDEEKAARKAPDKKKLMVLADALDVIEFPEVKSDEAFKILADTHGLLSKTAKFVREQAGKL